MNKIITGDYWFLDPAYNLIALFIILFLLFMFIWRVSSFDSAVYIMFFIGFFVILQLVIFALPIWKWYYKKIRYLNTALEPIVKKYGGSYVFRRILNTAYTSHFSKNDGYETKINDIKIFINMHFLSDLRALFYQRHFHESNTPDIEVLIHQKFPLELTKKMKELGYLTKDEALNKYREKYKFYKPVYGAAVSLGLFLTFNPKNDTVFVKDKFEFKDDPKKLSTELDDVLNILSEYV